MQAHYVFERNRKENVWRLIGQFDILRAIEEIQHRRMGFERKMRCLEQKPYGRAEIDALVAQSVLPK